MFQVQMEMSNDVKVIFFEENLGFKVLYSNNLCFPVKNLIRVCMISFFLQKVSTALKHICGDLLTK